MSSTSSTAIPSSSIRNQSFRRHLRTLALFSLLVLALSSNIRTTEAKPALPGSPAIIDVPFQMDDGQTGELILEPIDEMPQQSYWVVPERRMPSAVGLNGGQKRGSLGPRPLRFGRR